MRLQYRSWVLKRDVVEHRLFLGRSMVIHNSVLGICIHDKEIYRSNQDIDR